MLLLGIDERFREHDTGPGHPERPARLRAVEEGVARTEASRDGTSRIELRFATRAELERVHTIEHQVARWLLAMRDRSGSSNLNVTHDAIAELLGTRRAGVSVVLEGFRRDGLVASRRGSVRILDAPRLRDAACECYDVLRREIESLFERAGAA